VRLVEGSEGPVAAALEQLLPCFQFRVAGDGVWGVGGRKGLGQGCEVERVGSGRELAVEYEDLSLRRLSVLVKLGGKLFLPLLAAPAP
jgi:hypothetical protein